MAEEEKTKEVALRPNELIFKQLREQYKKPIEELRLMIRSESPVTAAGAKMALDAAKQFGLPLQGINLIPTKNGPAIYVNADGIRWRLHTDERGLKSSTTEVVHRPSKEEPWVEVVAKITMGDGSEYTAIGAVNCMPVGADVANSIMKSETKASRRAGVKAVGVALPIAEDYLEWADDERKNGKVVEAEFVIKEVKITEPTNLADLMLWIQQQGKTLTDAIKVAGEPGVMAGDITGAVKKLKDAWN